MSVRYRPGLPLALDSINFKINPGEKIGIVGRTGAGKSTLFSTILRFIDPCSGEVLIDGKGSTQYSIKDLRRGITVIDQESNLLTGNILYNLGLTNGYE